MSEQLDLAGSLPAPVVAALQREKEAEEREHFDWCSDDSILIPFQPETACYLNGAGSLVIRQRADDGEDDRFVFVTREYVRRLIDRLNIFEKTGR
jgi:hypothetical protein